jgi:hypothetical protein
VDCAPAMEGPSISIAVKATEMKFRI